jgi:tetratricopeptide (TPR) repeat protein
MRVHDLEKFEPTENEGKSNRWIWVAAVVLLVAAGAGGYFWLERSTETKPEAVSFEPMSEGALASFFERSGDDVGELVRLFASSDEIEKFAEKAATGKTKAVGKTRAVVNAIRARAAKRAFVPWSLIDPREGRPMMAADVYKAIEKDGAARKLYPLEIAALTVAASRTIGVDAMLAEAYVFSDSDSPPDPSGRLGYFVVAVPKGDDAGYHLFDPYGGQTASPQTGDFEVLTDVQAVGLAISLRALYKLVREHDQQSALGDSDVALRLAARSPTVRSARAVILFATGGASLGRSEMEAAAQIRDDAPRNNNLAALLVAQGELDAASKKVAMALEAQKGYASAHATLASIHFARGEQELGQAELIKAEKLDPNLPTLAMLWAHYYRSTGRLDLAIDKAQKSVRSRPGDLQARLFLATLLRQDGQYDEMRQIAREVIEEIPESQKEQMKKLIEGVLGPTALESPIEDDSDEPIPSDDEPAPPDEDFKLGKGLKLLDNGKQQRFGGSLLGSDSKSKPKLRLEQ